MRQRQTDHVNVVNVTYKTELTNVVALNFFTQFGDAATGQTLK